MRPGKLTSDCNHIDEVPDDRLKPIFRSSYRRHTDNDVLLLGVAMQQQFKNTQINDRQVCTKRMGERSDLFSQLAWQHPGIRASFERLSGSSRMVRRDLENRQSTRQLPFPVSQVLRTFLPVKHLLLPLDKIAVACRRGRQPRLPAINKLLIGTQKCIQERQHRNTVKNKMMERNQDDRFSVRQAKQMCAH
ncbi:hypothetical protein D3C81_1248670 [compost metagenome]